MKRHSQRGVALIITLIMLAIITVVAVIFLGIARRNRAGITVQQDQTAAEFAAEAALQRAKADVVAQIMSSKQLLGYDLTVSRGYDLWNNGASQMRDPRGDSNGPVLVNTNYAGASGQLDSRHFLDLNRTAEFEPTFTRLITNAAGIFTNTVIGDPEWILMLDRPDRGYSPDNRLIARMAYIVVPAGKALDINTAHNRNSPMSPIPSLSGGFTRNQGVGAWELNLAAMLHELDANRWDYSYGPFPTPVSRGAAFTNAFDLVFYRTNVSGRLPFTLNDLFTNAFYLTTNDVDDLGDDLLLAGTTFYDESAGSTRDSLTKPFAGADALRHYFTHQDFFDPNKTSLNFVQNLRSSLTNAANLPHTNGYKYYELLGELATDTGTENRNRINLNWAKLDPLTPWDVPTNKDLALTFFTNAAQRILESMAPDFRNWVINGVTNSVTNVNRIMIAPANFYNNAVHRIMQQTANIYDASRSDPFPSVFRPLFGSIGTNVFIVGWTNDNNITTLGTWLADNTNGIPLVVGAKKGLPNFNEYSFRTDMIVTRKLQLVRDTNASPSALPSQTNQMYVMGISNVASVEAWNPYYGKFPYDSTIEVSNTITFTLTNYAGLQGAQTIPAYGFTNILANAWEGWPGISRGTVANASSFKLPLLTNITVLSNSVFVARNNDFEQVGTNRFESGLANPFYLPDWNLVLSNQLVYIHRVGTNIIDFVVLRDNTVIDLSSNLAQNALSPRASGNVWDTNRNYGGAGPTDGLLNQIAFSKVSGNDNDWNAYSIFNGSYQGVNNDRDAAALKFRQFLGGATNSPAVMETPFNPVARLIYNKTWQANDPLVHYHVGDLTAFSPSTTMDPVKWRESNLDKVGASSITNVNRGYAPWDKPNDPAAQDYRLRDPGVSSSDLWNFPVNKFPSVGWLGRVHRGTPWQTVYFKAAGDSKTPALRLDEWNANANMSVSVVGGGSAVLNHPTNDIRFADIFTTALTDSSAQGLLSINQSRLGAWSAALSGVVVLSNWIDDNEVADVVTRMQKGPYQSILVTPTGGDANSPVWKIWNAIQTERMRVGGTFTGFAQLLALPELTIESPFLQLSDNQRSYGIDDAGYERIPQQILGLLRIGQPRVVIYAYGQALKPEHIDPATRKVDNYQITAEFATRTVLRIEGTALKPRVVVEAFNILPPD